MSPLFEQAAQDWVNDTRTVKMERSGDLVMTVFC